MSAKFLLDTNVVSEPLRPNPRAAVLKRLSAHEDEIVISSIVWHELRFGAARLPESRRREAIERYLETVVLATMPILDYDRAAAEWHADERTRLAARGETPAFADGQIAAIAGAHDLTLITFNTADFKRFRGIRVQSWDR
ncbi:MAG TPA: type II toxin-antitoxin system VapC family toxin [Thermoanaerobaculia bacterium]|nr:type II toxin-antitoxin system VapC family toxin [Thermoanaerobaculia bacterium]